MSIQGINDSNPIIAQIEAALLGAKTSSARDIIESIVLDFSHWS